MSTRDPDRVEAMVPGDFEARLRDAIGYFWRTRGVRVLANWPFRGAAGLATVGAVPPSLVAGTATAWRA